MSYYIMESSCIEQGDVVIYRVVKRLKDFKPEEGKKYRVFKSKKEKDTSLFVPTYIGKEGRLVKFTSEFSLRL